MPKEQMKCTDRTPFLRLEPERRLCEDYEDEGESFAPQWEEMGFCDLDDFCGEHIQ